MVKADKKKDMEAWLLRFEEQVGEPVVVSLLITKGEVQFLMCMPRKKYDSEPDDGDTESPAGSISEHKDKDYCASYLVRDYIQ